MGLATNHVELHIRDRSSNDCPLHLTLAGAAGVTFAVHAPETRSGSTLLVGSSAVMRDVRDQIATLGRFPWPVRVEGERGTGKNVAARLLHDASRRTGAFVKCGLNLVSAAEGRELGELLGWARGAFTGAIHAHPGAFERAHQGTLFLNEIGIASPRVQEILLDVLEEKAILRMGEERPRPVETRVVFATNVNLAAAVRAGAFRADLYDRLGHVLRIPPLRARLEDLPELSAALVIRKAREAQVPVLVLRPAELDRLMTFDWPGNVRQLELVVEHYLMYRQLPPWVPSARRRSGRWHATVAASLEQCQGNKAAAARALGISRKTLYEHLKGQQAGSAGKV